MMQIRDQLVSQFGQLVLSNIELSVQAESLAAKVKELEAIIAANKPKPAPEPTSDESFGS